MAVQIFNQTPNNLNENSINESYAMYLHKFVEPCGANFKDSTDSACAIMTYDEFKEYYILKILGRSLEFTKNIVRDYQLLVNNEQPLRSKVS